MKQAMIPDISILHSMTAPLGKQYGREAVIKAGAKVLRETFGGVSVHQLGSSAYSQLVSEIRATIEQGGK